MFGKTRDHEPALLDTTGFEGILGNEAAAEHAADIHGLRDRVEQMEAQIASQFTSLATYAQIAQEQVELARAEARTATERSEQRVTSLVERERADRMTAQGIAPVGSMPHVAGRLDAVEHLVAKLQQGLDECREQQLALATAITTMFDRLRLPDPVPPVVPVELPEVTVVTVDNAFPAPGPIEGLALA